MEVVNTEVRPPRRSPDHPNRSESQTGTSVVNKQQQPTVAINTKEVISAHLHNLLAMIKCERGNFDNNMNAPHIT